jgi:hypothetical protein
MNQTVLIVAWIPINSEWCSTLKFNRFLKNLKNPKNIQIVSWGAKASLGDIMNFNSLVHVPNTADLYYLGHDLNLAIIDERQKKLVEDRPMNMGNLAMEVYQDVVVVFGWNCPIRLVRNFEVIWTSNDALQYCYRTGGWCSYQRMTQMYHGQLYFVESNHDQLIHIDLLQLLPMIENKTAATYVPRVIDSNVADVAVDRHGLFYMKQDGQVFHKGESLCQSDLHYGTNTCLALGERFLITGAYSYRKTTLILFSSQGRQLHKLEIPEIQLMRLKVWKAKGIALVAAASMFERISIATVFKNKLYLVVESLKVSTGGQGIVCGLVPKFHRPNELIVHGSDFILLTVKLNF